MAAKKSYNRFFIILQEEDRGYGMGSDRPPTGYVKVETKNDKSKVTVYVQNLKPYETGECLYRCYLISHQDDKDNMAYLGIMNIDDSGRGESSWESGAEDAFSTKTPVDKFNAAAIIADREGSQAVVAPLAGYMSKEKFEWRSKVVKAKPVEVKPEVLEVKPETVELSPEAAKFDEYEKQVAEATAANIREEIKVEEVKVEEVKVEEVKIEAPHVEDAAVIEEEEDEVLRDKHKHHKEHEEHEFLEEMQEHLEEIVEEFEEHHEEKHEECKEHEHHEEKHEECEKHEHHEEHKKHEGHKGYDYMKGWNYTPYPCPGCPANTLNYLRHMMKKMLEDILSDYEEKDGLKDLKGCRMWKVDMAKCKRDGHMVQMYPCYDLVFLLMMYNPSLNYFNYIGKHGHYLFGIKYGKDKEVKRIVYAIPGKNKPFDQPFGGRTGFIKWVPDGKGDDGYWIMMYDPATGMVDFTER